MPASEISDIHVKLIDAHKEGDNATVRKLYERILPLLTMQAVFRWRLTKEVLRRRGLINSAFVRAAGPIMDEKDHEELDMLIAALEPLMEELDSPFHIQQFA